MAVAYFDEGRQVEDTNDESTELDDRMQFLPALGLAVEKMNEGLTLESLWRVI